MLEELAVQCRGMDLSQERTSKHDVIWGRCHYYRSREMKNSRNQQPEDVLDIDILEKLVNGTVIALKCYGGGGELYIIRFQADVYRKCLFVCYAWF